MKQFLKQLVPSFYLDYLHRKRVETAERTSLLNWRQIVYNDWLKSGKPLPPPHAVKQVVIEKYRSEYNINTLIETGTFRGDMINAQKVFFNKIYSIELDPTLHNEAKRKFQYFRNIHLIQGDSGKEIFKLISQIDEKSIFWLDGHYSGMDTALGDVECPVLGEIDGIFSGSIKNHVLLIDDARCFTGNNSYPTIEELHNYVIKYNSKYKMEVDCDVIRFVAV
jgi:hypothetical protein